MSAVDCYDYKESHMFVHISSTARMYTGTRWEMSVDLHYLGHHAGVRGEGLIPINKAKKILRLVYLYTNNEDKEEISLYLKRFPKLIKIWEKLP